MTAKIGAPHPEGLELWQTVGRQLIADGSPWLKLWSESVRLPDGRVIEPYYSVEQPDFVVVFPVSSDRQILTIWHYKHGPRRINLGLPAGFVAPGEAPAAAARRELLEETGHTAEHFAPLGAFSVDGNRGCGRGHIFLASGLQLRSKPTRDDLEEIVLEWMSPASLGEALDTGKVATMGAAAAIAVGLLQITKEMKST